MNYDVKYLKQDWTQHHNINVDLRKQKNTDWKKSIDRREDYLNILKELRKEKVKRGNENVNKLLKQNPLDNIIKLKKLIYAGAKLLIKYICHKETWLKKWTGKWG